MLIGVVVSAALHVLVPEDAIRRLIHGKRIALAVPIATLSGMLFPVCECGIVPIARRLIRKGLPVNAAMAFMLAAPIVNPLVIASTAYAFPGRFAVVLLRILLGLATALAVGLMTRHARAAKIVSGGEEAAGCGCGHDACAARPDRMPPGAKVWAILEHASDEFFEVGRYLFLGALAAALFQTLIPRSFILAIGRGRAVSILVMMAFAFALSLCSEADAFIAASFAGSFPTPALLAFMVFGPMLDLKNLLLLLGGFRKRFVLRLVLSVSVAVFSLTYILGLFG